MQEHPGNTPVWRFTREDGLWESLGPREASRAAALPPRRQAEYLRSRTLLHRLLETGTSSGPLDLDPGPGAPGWPGSGLFLSVSHSRDASLVCHGPHPVGCDLEPLDSRPRDWLALARRWFTPVETESLQDLGTTELASRFLQLWTRKEAVFKTGLATWEEALSTPWQVGPQPWKTGEIRIDHPAIAEPGWCACLAWWQGPHLHDPQAWVSD